LLLIISTTLISVVLILKKLICIFMILIFTLSLCTVAFAYEGSCSAEAAILFQPDTNTVLYEKNAYDDYLIASTTKIMTALVVLENVSTDEIVDILPEYTKIEGSSMYLKTGERFTVKELVYGLMLMSGNDAAAALACHVSGSIEEFAALMNEKAYELGCLNTHFENPHGLDSDMHYSCAFDLALIMQAAMKIDAFAEINSTKEIEIAGRSMINHNKLLWECEGCIGGKTGYTEKAGRTLVSVCERDGMELICVTISDRDDWSDHKSLFDWGYSEFALTDLSPIIAVPVISGDKETVRAVCERSDILTDKNCDISINLPQFVYAPVSIGEQIGSVCINTEDEACEYKIIAAESVDVDEAVPLNFWEQLKWAWYYYNGHTGHIPFIPRY